MTTALKPLTSIHQATALGVPWIATTLARAFHDDPVFRWIYPNERRRTESLPGAFSVYAEVLQRHHETYVVDDFAGVALWVPPGEPAIADDEAEEFAQRIGEMAGREADRLFEVMELIDEHHPHTPSWFLHLLGVEPERQGRGHGGTLLSEMLERLDREGAAASLDATSPDSKRLYERYGFEATGEYGPAGGPSLWSMWRES